MFLFFKMRGKRPESQTNSGFLSVEATDHDSNMAASSRLVTKKKKKKGYGQITNIYETNL